ncbi:MAG: hypothetical protein VX869_03925 [Chloroflexota bacterium]|nr:hypothetical protein [Chloroflexota bacterium]
MSVAPQPYSLSPPLSDSITWSRNRSSVGDFHDRLSFTETISRASIVEKGRGSSPSITFSLEVVEVNIHGKT